MSITATQASLLILNDPGEYSSASAIRNLVSQLSTDAPGKVTVTYSGTVADGIGSGAIVESEKGARPI